MADIADLANDQIDRQRQAILQARHRSPTASLTHCLECGDTIPAARQEAAPGCELCITCQEWTERGGGFWP